MTYNGYRNWETWELMNHILNDEIVFNDMVDVALDYKENEDLDNLSDEINYMVDEWVNEGVFSLLIEGLIGDFFSKIDWEKIADYFVNIDE